MEIPSVPSFPSQHISTPNNPVQTTPTATLTSSSNYQSSSNPSNQISNQTTIPSTTQSEKKKTTKQKSITSSLDQSNCIQEYTKRAPRQSTISSFTERYFLIYLTLIK